MSAAEDHMRTLVALDRLGRIDGNRVSAGAWIDAAAALRVAAHAADVNHRYEDADRRRNLAIDCEQRAAIRA